MSRLDAVQAKVAREVERQAKSAADQTVELEEKRYCKKQDEVGNLSADELKLVADKHDMYPQREHPSGGFAFDLHLHETPSGYNQEEAGSWWAGSGESGPERAARLLGMQLDAATLEAVFGHKLLTYPLGVNLVGFDLSIKSGRVLRDTLLKINRTHRCGCTALSGVVPLYLSIRPPFLHLGSTIPPARVTAVTVTRMHLWEDEFRAPLSRLPQSEMESYVECVQTLGEFMGLERLNLADAGLNAEWAVHLAQAMPAMAAMTELNLDSNDIFGILPDINGNGAEPDKFAEQSEPFFAALKDSQIATLSLKRTGMGPVACGKLATLISAARLTKLDVGDKRLDTLIQLLGDGQSIVRATFEQPGLLGLTFNGAWPIVESIQEGSAAASQDELRKGLVLVEIQDQDMRGKTMAEVGAVLGSAGRPLRLAFVELPPEWKPPRDWIVGRLGAS